MNLSKKNLYIFAIAFLTIGIYFNTFKNAFQFDDIIHILKNDKIKYLSNIPEILTEFLSRPLLFAAFTLNYYVSGTSTAGYHAVNILLHIGVSVLIYLMLLDTIGIYKKADSNHSPAIPFLAALIFAIHPINTESVTYIISRSSILSAFFCLLSLLMFIKAVKREGIMTKTAFYFLSLLSFVFALGSKEDAVMLPIIALFYYLFFIAPVKTYNFNKNLKIILFFIIIISLYPLVRYFKFGIIGTGEASGIYTPFTYLLTEFNVIIFYYLKLLFLPINLNVDPDIRPIISLINLSTLTAIAIISLLGIAVFKSFKKDTILSFSIVWFLIALAPTSTIFPLWDAAAEHRVYLSAIGFSIFLARLISKIRIKNVYIVPSLLVIILLSFSLCTIKRNFIWKDRVSLWEDAVGKSPSKARPHAALGLAYNEEKGLIEEAIRQYRIALGIKPLYFDALNNLGIALDMKGDMDGAMQNYKLALIIKPNSPELYNNIGIIYAKKGERERAIEEFKRALNLAPNYIEARRNIEMVIKDIANLKGSTSVDRYR